MESEVFGNLAESSTSFLFIHSLRYTPLHLKSYPFRITIIIVKYNGNHELEDCNSSLLTLMLSRLTPHQVALLSPFLALVSSAPASPPTFPTDNKYTITTGGTHGNQGAHPLIPSVSSINSTLSKLSTILPRNGVGSVVTGAGLNWYTSSFTTGGSGYADPQYYYCFNGPASNFPPFANWMNFYDMFDLNQQDSLDSEESGPIQGDLYNAIVQVSENAQVDARFVLAIIMQEVSLFGYFGTRGEVADR